MGEIIHPRRQRNCCESVRLRVGVHSAIKRSTIYQLGVAVCGVNTYGKSGSNNHSSVPYSYTPNSHSNRKDKLKSPNFLSCRYHRHCCGRCIRNLQNTSGVKIPLVCHIEHGGVCCYQRTECWVS